MDKDEAQVKLLQKSVKAEISSGVRAFEGTPKNMNIK
jgi:hypothetical protein